MLTEFRTAENFDLPRAGVDAVFDELSHRVERIALRQRDNGDGVPVVTDTKLPGNAGLAGFCLGLGHVILRFR